MKIDGWEFPFDTLPKWDIHNSTHAHDFLMESSSAEYACLFYSAEEWRMCWYKACLAILSGKEHPQLLVNSANISWFPYAKFSTDGNILFLCAYAGGFEFPLVIINLEKKQFTPIRVVNGFQYSIEERDCTHFKMVKTEKERESKAVTWADGKKINLKRLRWLPLDRIDQLGDLLNDFKRITHYLNTRNK